MLTHSICNQLLLKNVRVEVVYEDSPVFADEEVSAIVRFRHLGEPVGTSNNNNGVQNAIQEEETQGIRSEGKDSDNQQQPSTNPEEDNGWFGKRVSVQLSNAARSLFLEEAEQTEKKPKLRNKPVDFLSGYVQLSGFFTFDEEVVDSGKLKDFRSKAAVAGRIGGLEGLELSKSQNGGMIGSITSGLGNLFNTSIDEVAAEDVAKKKELEKLIPFFSTSQSLLFSELHLKPGEVKTFYFKCKLPKALPPSYDGSSLTMSYHFIVGASLNRQIPKPLNIHFPLKIYPNFDESGYQPTSSLDKFILLPPDKILNDTVQTGNGRRSSFRTIKKVILTQPKLTSNTKKEKFLSRIEDLIQKEGEQDFNISDFKNTSTKETIALFSENLNSKGTIDESEPEKFQKEGYTYEKQVTKLQTQYIISRNGQSLTTLTLSKPFYRIGDEIVLTLDFKDKDLHTTGVLISLESLELIRDTYSADLDTTKTLPRVLSFYKDSFPAFNTTELQVSLPIPLSASPQFRTNIFESKWCLSVKFVLSEEEKLSGVHRDDTGTIYLARDNVNGTDFVCRLPITVIPPSKDFGGITI